MPLDEIALIYWISDLDELNDEYFRDMRVALYRHAEATNLKLNLYRKGSSLANIHHKNTGFIAVGTFNFNEYEQLTKEFKKGVFIESQVDIHNYDGVSPDLHTITRTAIRYFLDNKIRKIGFIGGGFYNPETHHTERDSREVAFRNYLSSYNLLNEAYIFTGGKFSVENGYELAQKALNTLGKDGLPEAFLVAADPLAIGALQAFNESKIEIPEKLSIISINNINISKYVYPALTTFHIDTNEIAHTAISLINEQIEFNRVVNKTVLIGGKYVERKSFIRVDGE